MTDFLVGFGWSAKLPTFGRYSSVANQDITRHIRPGQRGKEDMDHGVAITPSLKRRTSFGRYSLGTINNGHSSCKHLASCKQKKL